MRYLAVHMDTKTGGLRLETEMNGLVGWSQGTGSGRIRRSRKSESEEKEYGKSYVCGHSV